MTKDTALALTRDGLEFIRNLIVSAALIKVGAAINYEPTLVSTEDKGRLVAYLVVATGVLYGFAAAIYIGCKHWPTRTRWRIVALITMILVATITEGTFMAAARIADRHHANAVEHEREASSVNAGDGGTNPELLSSHRRARPPLASIMLRQERT